jgi:hypothetical protein
MDRPALNRLPATAHNIAIEEREHFEECPVCHQWFDCWLLGDVLHHDQPDHEPLPLH